MLYVDGMGLGGKGLDQGCRGQPFFASGQGGVGQRKKLSGRGGAGQGENAQGGVTVKPRGIFGVGRGILENFWGQGAPGQPFPPGSGRGVHP